ncbi:MAG TPA: FtsW/RodA/SpoVE family cell cycle protein [Clostridiales bacterium]|jgi:cell division protein FtsW|nr:FtsW/RodA/SpoVE family cell cycle protein [Clostridiales bacterium]
MKNGQNKSDFFLKDRIFIPIARSMVDLGDRLASIKKEGFFVKGQLDLLIFTATVFLMAFGLIMFFSVRESVAFKEGVGISFINRNTLLLFISILLMLFVSKINPELLRLVALPLLIVSLIFLLWALVIPAEIAGKESIKRFIHLPVIGQFQPSDLAKYALTLFLAGSIYKHNETINQKPIGVYSYLLISFVFAILVLLGGHLSGAIIMMAIGLFMALLSDAKLKYHLPWIVTGILGAALLFSIFYGAVHEDSFLNIFPGLSAKIRNMAVELEKSELSGFKMQILRVYSWLAKDYSPKGKRYQVNQALEAIASGGMFGRGLGNSVKKFGYLPETANDFIYPILCEEFGLVGGLAVMLAFVLILLRSLSVADGAKSRFESVLALGLALQISLHAVLHIAIVTDVIPNTGMALPFISSGGSALMVNAVSVGTILSISRRARKTKLRSLFTVGERK